jgi:hypothetical protein
MKKQITLAALALTLGSFLNAQIISTVAGDYKKGAGYSGDKGQATAAELDLPHGLCFDASGNMYIADYQNSVIRKVTPAGIITTVAGNGNQGYTGDNGPATAATMEFPYGVCVDSKGNIYIADEDNSAVRKVNTSGTITTFAGLGFSHNGYTGDGGQATAAQLCAPTDVINDANDNVYIADSWNNVIREVTVSNGIINTIVGIRTNDACSGNGAFSGDGGPATLAELDHPSSIAFDNAGNLYISDEENNRIREVQGNGNIYTIAGTGLFGYSGDNGPASAAAINTPYAIILDPANNVFIADNQNHVIREITAWNGNIITVAGDSTLGRGYSGDGGQATAAQMYDPTGLARDNMGNLYISDDSNNVVREVTNIATGIRNMINTVTSARVNVYPNPAKNEFTVQWSGNNAKLVELYSLTGQMIIQQYPVSDSRLSTLNTQYISDGIYFLKVQMQDGSEIVNKVEIIK